jgi:hypothetical protein
VQKEPCEIFHVEHAAGYFFGCRLCRKKLAGGTWTIGLKIGESARYFVGHNPPIICCGEQKTIPLVFDSEGDLLPVSDQLQATLNREGTTASLMLIGFAIVESTATH